MTKTKRTNSANPVPTYDPEGPITTFQKKRIMHNCNYQVEIKNEWVQWVTGDTNKTSLSTLTQAQAIRVIKQQTGADSLVVAENWGAFDKENGQHRYILSILRQANIVVPSDKHGEIPDTAGWLNRFLQSPKSPVKKPLKDMSKWEVSRIIIALENVSIWKSQI